MKKPFRCCDWLSQSFIKVEFLVKTTVSKSQYNKLKKHISNLHTGGLRVSSAFFRGLVT